MQTNIWVLIPTIPSPINVLSLIPYILNRAENISTPTSGKKQERIHVFNVLMDNGYPKQFLLSMQ
jgi:hypothetical protein